MKIRWLTALAAFAIGFAVPVVAQEQNTVDPEVRQQIEAVLAKYHEAYNKNDAAAIATLYTADAVEVFEKDAAGGVASGLEAIEKRYAEQFASNPSKLSLTVIQVCPFGDGLCAISELSRRFRAGKSYHANIFVREADEWKIRLAYAD
jgi:uncharacterized protein (TIGR02246 family)